MSSSFDPYVAADSRYERIGYRRCGRSGLRLPLVSLGMWQHYGGADPYADVRTRVRRAFDLGVTHFDFGNNYGDPPGSAEETFGRLLRDDFRSYRDELIISTKAGYRMWPGPYGEFGSRKYLISSLDQSLTRLGVDYVDIFYSHRFDPDTPLEETMGALEQIVRQGKALYVGISSYSAAKTREAIEILRRANVPCLVHQSSYSLFNRWSEDELLDVLDEAGIGFMAFTPLAQGLLSDKYLTGIPAGARAGRSGSTIPSEHYSASLRDNLAGLARLARDRGQTLAQMALAWVLRRTTVVSALIGARTIEQLEENVAATRNLKFTAEELQAIDRFAVEEGVDLWRESSSHGRRPPTSDERPDDRASAGRAHLARESRANVEPIVRTRCVACGAKHLDEIACVADIPVYVGCANQPPEDDAFIAMRWCTCSSCGTLQLGELVPSQLLYQNAHNGAVGRSWAEHHRTFAEFVLAHGGSSRLELGGGTGALAKCVRSIDAGGRWLIVEPNPCIDSPIANTEIVRGVLDDSFRAPFAIDTVVHSHVMEHWYEPRDQLARIWELLPMGGSMCCSIPQMERMLSLKLSNCINFEHTYYLTEDLAERMFAAEGFAVEAKQVCGEMGLFFACRKVARGEIDWPDHGAANRAALESLLAHQREDAVAIQRQLDDERGQKYIFGAHIFTQYLLAFGLRETGFVAVLDNDPAKIGRRIYGTRLWAQSPRCLAGDESPIVVLRVGAYDEEIRQQLLEINPRCRIV